MSTGVIAPAVYTFGPSNAHLTVRTGRTGPAARAGHNLLIEPRNWQATFEVSAAEGRSSIALTVDTGSLHVLEGTGGMQALGDEDKDSIVQTINDEILKRTVVEFRSTRVELGPDGLAAEGELELMGQRHPLAFTLSLDGAGRLTGRTTFRQSDWGLKPFSTLFGTLKVADEVEIAVDADLGKERHD
jgi:hypothetical protein